ncbi:MAG: TldD/PmbA family protein [Candidatus Neomarinimicrobiota bacterium]|nr:TldD/PmbA family protein [Candidatus Neomarinimicrobiota bacterium]
MQNQDIPDYCIEQLMKAGADKAQCIYSSGEKKELNVDAGEFSLFRTNANHGFSIMAIKDQKKGSFSINKIGKDDIDEAISTVLNMAESSMSDDAYDISEYQEADSFSKGDKEPALNIMYDRMEEFMEYSANTFPITIIEQAILDFSSGTSYYRNSNGVSFDETEGSYSFSVMFTSKEGKDISSFNSAGFSSLDIDLPLHKGGSINRLLEESAAHVRTRTVPNKFTGDIIVTPDCIMSFIGFILGNLSDFRLIAGTSLFRELMNQQIVHESLSIHSKPLSDNLSGGYFITSDGYKAEDLTIIENGILQTFLLSLYGSNKTGLQRVSNSGGSLIIDPGETPLKDMIQSVNKGVLLSRFSGGSPSDNGDFSGVAKNSFYIENGKVQYPISETMVSGNIVDMFQHVKHLSKEEVNFGDEIFPWIQFEGITVS